MQNVRVLNKKCVGHPGRSAAPSYAIIQKEKEKHYPDVGDNVHANVSSWLDVNCAGENKWFIPGVCENGHRVAKVIACGKEWCPECGKLNSIAHNRRYVRWLTKIMQFKRMDYLVFTIPESYRGQYRHKADLTELGRRAQELMKRHGFERGLRRWHWFGDRSNKWNPHLNVLVEGGYIKAEKLEHIKEGWARILGTGKDIENVHNKYKSTSGDMAGCLSYVTRATFLDYEWDIDMAQELRGFRNMVVWGKGKWNQEPIWELSKTDRTDAVTGETIDVEAIEHLVNHECPKCGAKVHWDKALPSKLLSLVDTETLGAGYYHIVDRSPPDRLSGDVKKRLAFMRLIWMARCMGAVMVDNRNN